MPFLFTLIPRASSKFGVKILIFTVRAHKQHSMGDVRCVGVMCVPLLVGGGVNLGSGWVHLFSLFKQLCNNSNNKAIPDLHGIFMALRVQMYDIIVNFIYCTSMGFKLMWWWRWCTDFNCKIIFICFSISAIGNYIKSYEWKDIYRAWFWKVMLFWLSRALSLTLFYFFYPVYTALDFHYASREISVITNHHKFNENHSVMCVW